MEDSREAAKQLICDIVRAFGGELAGKVRLYKAFYYAHLYYWRGGKGILTSHPIVRMPFGPGIDDGEDLLAELAAEGRVQIEYREVGPYPETVLRVQGSLGGSDQDPRTVAIRQAVDFTRSKTASQLSDETHEYSRSWAAAEKDGEELNIYIDLLSDGEYRDMIKEGNRARRLVDAALRSE